MKISSKIIIVILIVILAIILLFVIIFKKNLHSSAIVTNDTGTAIIIKTPISTSQKIKDLNLKKHQSIDN
jgi:hypothetical protein